MVFRRSLLAIACALVGGAAAVAWPGSASAASGPCPERDGWRWYLTTELVNRRPVVFCRYVRIPPVAPTPPVKR